ncbi:MAG: FAD:protein FMN transferase, partial [Phycisphaerae bacterium]
RMLLRRGALAGSAASPAHPHILDPRTSRPVLAKRAAWALAPSAAEADALSTAFFVMSPDEVRRYCESHGDVSAMLAVDATRGTKVARFGTWHLVT